MKSARMALTGLRVLVCRPEARATELCDALERRGAIARSLPMIEIDPLPEDAERRTLIQNFDHYQRIIVVSPTAAEMLLECLDRWWPQLPADQNWYAVGAGTGAVLQEAGIRCAIPTLGHDSEGLLEHPGLGHVTDQKILICGGEGGRTLLRDELTERGAQVAKLALYQRQCPAYSEDQMREALAVFNPQAIIALSGETLNNLLSLGQNADRALRQRMVVVPTLRVAEHARAAGFEQPVVAEALDPAGLELALLRGTGCTPDKKELSPRKKTEKGCP